MNLNMKIKKSRTELFNQKLMLYSKIKNDERVKVKFWEVRRRQEDGELSHGKHTLMTKENM